MGVDPEAVARLEEVPVCIHNVTGARPTAQQCFMCNADEDMPSGVLIADEEPCVDQGPDEGRSRGSACNFGEQGRTCRDRFIARTCRGEGAQHRGWAFWISGASSHRLHRRGARLPLEPAERAIMRKVNSALHPASYNASSTNSRSGKSGSAAAASCSIIRR